MNSTSHMYLSPKSLAERFDMSEITVRRRIGEIKEEKIYGPNVVIDDGVVRTYLPAFIHYINNRRFLTHKSMRKHVPEYQPESIIKELALDKWDTVPKVTQPDKDQIREIILEVLQEGFRK